MLPSARIVVSFGAAASALAALGLVVTLARAEPPEGASTTFALERNATPIGTHRVRFSRDRDDVIVSHDLEIQVTLAFVDFYRYRLTSRERWRAGRLIALDARVNKNGTPLQVMLRAMRHETVVQTSAGRATAPADVVPQSPSWNVLSSVHTTMIDAETGALSRVQVTGPATESLSIRGATVPTLRYRVRGGDGATLWYDANDLLVRKRLTAVDGSTIVYTLRRSTP